MKLNTLHTSQAKHPDFEQGIDQLFIDGILIGELINELLDYNGRSLLPSLSPEMCNDNDRGYLWSLLDNFDSEEMYFPLLMCTEADLSCFEHMVFVYVKQDAKYVYWTKFGVVLNPKEHWRTLKKYPKKKEKLLHLSKTVDQVELNDIKWIIEDQIYQFDKAAYESVINFYRQSNQEKDTTQNDPISRPTLWQRLIHKIRK